MGDIHVGSIHCAEHAIEAQIKTVQNDPEGYWLGMGDYADCIIKNDDRFDMGGLAPWVVTDNIVESQRQRITELFEPIAQKCIGLISGNHEEAIHKKYQIDFTRNLAKDLGVPYAGYTCFVNLIFRRNSSKESHAYRIHAWHGSGGAQTEGARLNRLIRLVNEIEAHIYLMGHLHAMTQHTPDRLCCLNGRVRSIKLAATLTGSWLKGYTQAKAGQVIPPSYVEIKGYKPSRLGCPVIHIRPDRDQFTIES